MQMFAWGQVSLPAELPLLAGQSPSRTVLSAIGESRPVTVLGGRQLSGTQYAGRFSLRSFLDRFSSGALRFQLAQFPPASVHPIFSPQYRQSAVPQKGSGRRKSPKQPDRSAGLDYRPS